MAEITIDRLTLKLSALSDRDSQRLVRLIAEGLATASPADGAARQIDALRVNIAPQPGDSLDRLSEQIVADILRQLQRTL